MALTIDASTPAIVAITPGPGATTASFTPPAGSLITIAYSGDTVGGHTPAVPTITDNLGVHLTYTALDFKSRASGALADGQAASWRAVVGSSAAMTITVTNQDSASTEGALEVKVWTGQDAVTPIGAHGSGGAVSAAAIAQSYTATANGSWGVIGVTDWDVKGVETAGTGCTRDGSANIGTAITYGFFRRTSADGVSGVSNTLNVTLPGTSTNLSWVWFEVIPATTTATYPPARLERRRFGFPRVVRARSSTPVRAQVNPPFPFTQVTQPRRERGMPPRRVHAVTPVPPQFNPPFPYRAMTQARRLRGLLSRRPEIATVVPPQVVVTAAPYVIANVRVRIRALLLRRRTPAVPPAVVGLVPQTFRRPVRPMLVRHVHTFLAPQPQATPPSPPIVLAPPRRRVRAYLVRRSHAAIPPVPQVAPTLFERMRTQLPRRPRPRAAQVVPAQIILIAPTYAPQAVHAKARQWALRRRRTGVDAWLTSDHSCVTPRPGSGTTVRPSTGMTVRAAGTTSRPGSGMTIRPNTGVTEEPC